MNDSLRPWLLALVILSLLASSAGPCVAQSSRASRAEREGDKAFALQASIDYFYGDWDSDQLDLDPRLGMVGLAVESWFLNERWGLGLEYLSGDFDGQERVALTNELAFGSGEDYGSHKELTQSASREDVSLVALYRPLAWLVLEAGYRYMDYERNAMVDLVSEIRAYGGGSENYRAEARGLGVGARALLPIRGPWSLALSARAMPILDTQIRGSYMYDLPLAGRALSEDWTCNGEASGFDGEAAVQYSLPKEPVSLRVGYRYHRIESSDDIEKSAVDDDLGQGPRDWQDDEFRGLSVAARFSF